MGTQKTKIIDEGQPCRHCGSPVIKRTHNPKAKRKTKKVYYFEYFFWCAKCNAVYFVEGAKRFWSENSNLNGVSPQKK